uniref:Peptidase M12B domain-containing protein n=1 Tax=Branchiostoma floridae TaxID=7739 RepID=C3YVJ3_BRAFL|eukprot:XP_002599704.1 hypothetical protein BRAFLDRAFT_70384 [Branchiostoma floridae]
MVDLFSNTLILKAWPLIRALLRGKSGEHQSSGSPWRESGSLTCVSVGFAKLASGFRPREVIPPPDKQQLLAMSLRDASVSSQGHHRLAAIVSSAVPEYDVFVPQEVDLPADLTRSAGCRDDRGCGDGDRRFYSVQLFGTKHLLNLTRDMSVAAAGLRVVGTNGEVIPRTLDCFFTGEVQGLPGSNVALSTCNGLHGVVVASGEDFVITPMSGGLSLRSRHPRSANGQTGKPHIVYRRSSQALDDVTALTEHGLHKDATVKPLHPRRTKRGTARADSRNRLSPSRRLTIELALFVDRNAWDKVESLHEGSAEEKFQWATTYYLSVINTVQLLYNSGSLGHRVQLSVLRLRIIEGNEFISDNNDTEKTLHNFCMAPVSGMCSEDRSCSLNEDSGLGSAFLLGHEIGHNLGMRHDGDQNNCADGQFIMATHTGPGHMEWSPCSADHFSHFLLTDQSDCLNDSPSPRAPPELALPTGELPGERYTADQQCELRFGEGTEEHKYFRSSICTRLTCLDRPNHKIWWSSSPAAEGTSCGTGKVRAHVTSFWSLINIPAIATCSTAGLIH